MTALPKVAAYYQTWTPKKAEAAIVKAAEELPKLCDRLEVLEGFQVLIDESPIDPQERAESRQNEVTSAFRLVPTMRTADEGKSRQHEQAICDEHSETQDTKAVLFEAMVADAGPINFESGEWIEAKQGNKKSFRISIGSLRDYRKMSKGGWVGGDGWYGVDRDRRIWRKADGYEKARDARTFYYVPSLPERGERAGIPRYKLSLTMPSETP